MPNAPGAGQENVRGSYQWLHIDDFSPGIHEGTYTTVTGAAPTAGPIVTAPLGAASPENTWACASLPSGGLGPLPGVTATHNFTNFQGATTFYLQAGFIINPGLNNYGGNEVLSILEADDATNRFYLMYSVVPGNSYATNAITPPTATTATAGAGFFGAPYPVWTRMNATGTGNPPPTLVFPTSDDTGAAGGHLWIYPEILSPTSFVAQDIVGASVTGQTIAYGSRVIVLAGVTYSWPVTGGINTNENVNFTDPPLSSAYGSQETILGAELPWGYGAWGSVSVGELLLIKKTGGALIVYGDIFAPTSVITVPGVQPTGDIVGSAAATPTGLYYCAEKRGAWVWNGGNTSTKISPQLSDDFFDIETNVIGSNNYGFFAYHWQNWVLFSGNYLYNADQGNWWILYPTAAQSPSAPTGDNLFWYCQGAMGNQLFAAPLILNKVGGSAVWWYQFDNTVPASKYSWQSVPIHVVKDADRVVNVREIVIRASSPDGDTHNTIKATIGSWTATSSLSIATTPTMIRFNVGSGAMGLQDIELTLVAANSNSKSAPLIHSVDIAYDARAEIAPNN